MNHVTCEMHIGCSFPQGYSAGGMTGGMDQCEMPCTQISRVAGAGARSNWMSGRVRGRQDKDAFVT